MFPEGTVTKGKSTERGSGYIQTPKKKSRYLRKRRYMGLFKIVSSESCPTIENSSTLRQKKIEQ